MMIHNSHTMMRRRTPALVPSKTALRSHRVFQPTNPRKRRPQPLLDMRQLESAWDEAATLGFGTEAARTHLEERGVDHDAFRLHFPGVRHLERSLSLVQGGPQYTTFADLVAHIKDPPYGWPCDWNVVVVMIRIALAILD